MIIYALTNVIIGYNHFIIFVFPNADSKSIPKSTASKAAPSWVKCKQRRVNTAIEIIDKQETLDFNHMQEARQFRGLVTFRRLSLNVQLFVWRQVTNVVQILASNFKLAESPRWTSFAKMFLNQRRDLMEKQ